MFTGRAFAIGIFKKYGPTLLLLGFFTATGATFTTSDGKLFASA